MSDACSRCKSPLVDGRCPNATPETMEDTIERLTTERDSALSSAAEYMRQLEEVRAENERLRHGNTIEGDFVCPNELALANLRTLLVDTKFYLSRMDVAPSVTICVWNEINPTLQERIEAAIKTEGK